MPQLFFANVMHRRLRPKENKFTYRVMYLALPLKPEGHPATTRWLKYNRFGLYSFYDRDHGAKDGSPLLPWIQKILADHKITQADGEILLVAHPRLLGYVFNPVSFWLCLDKAGNLRAVLAEVNNTFGETHRYLIAHADHRPIAADDWLQARKMFHVSPFLPVEGGYHFRFAQSEGKLGIWIDYDDTEGRMLHTALTGRLETATDKALFKQFCHSPLMTLAVVLRIHWQAIKLWRKQAKFYTKPAPPNDQITRG